MNRIELLASLSRYSSTLLDIGCDHAYVLITALKKYDVKRGIAADVAVGPLNSAKENIKANNLSDRVTFALSDGFKNINEAFDTAIIAGMGGILIASILEDGKDKLNNKKLILEPNSDQYLVRKKLYELGFIITDEYSIIDQGKYYEIICASQGENEYSDFELKYGPILLKRRDIEFINYYQKKLDMLNNVIDKINNINVKNEKLLLMNEYKKIIAGEY